MIGWLDCSSGASGDMLLGALVDAGVPLSTLQRAVDAVAPEPVRLKTERVSRAGIAATRVHVRGTESTTRRTLPDVRALVGAADGLAPQVRERVLAVFERLAAAEAKVHGTTPEEVHFHEVGALDAIADIVAGCAGLNALHLDRLVSSPVALGGGFVQSVHGRLPVPAPAVVLLLAGVPTYGGPVAFELTTPTGAAMLAAHADAWGHQPPMRVAAQGFGAGAGDPQGHPDVLRLVLGEPVEHVAPEDSDERDEPALVLETNVDDLDPRLWPCVLTALLEAGASDAWLSPALMKKGRPAHTLHVLLDERLRDAVERVVFSQTSAIGVRSHRVRKRALERRFVAVDVDGQQIRIKLALLGGDVVNSQPEYADVAAAARALGRPAKTVLAQAVAAASHLSR